MDLWKGHRMTLTLTERSQTYIKKKNKKRILRFYPDNKLVNDQYEKVGGDGQNGKGRKRGALLKMGKNRKLRLFWKRREVYTVHRTLCHTRKHFLARDSRLKRSSRFPVSIALRHIQKESSSALQVARFMLMTWQHTFSLVAQHRVFTLSSKQE